MIASLRTPVSGSFVIVMPEPRYRPASPSEWIGIGSLVRSASAPRRFTSLHGASATTFDCPGTRLNMRSERSRTTFLGVVPRACAWRARSLTRMSHILQPGKPRNRSSMSGRGAAEKSAPAWVTGSTSSSIRIRSLPSAARKSLRVSGMTDLLLRFLGSHAEIRQSHVWVPQQRGSLVLEHDAALLQHVGAVTDRQRDVHVLLDEEHGDPALVDAADGADD